MAYIISRNYREDRTENTPWLVRHESRQPHEASAVFAIYAENVEFAPSSVYEQSMGCHLVAVAEKVQHLHPTEPAPSEARRFTLHGDRFVDKENSRTIPSMDRMWLIGYDKFYAQKDQLAEPEAIPQPEVGDTVEVTQLGVWGSSVKVGMQAQIEELKPHSRGVSLKLRFENGLFQYIELDSIWNYCKPIEATKPPQALAAEAAEQSAPAIYYGAVEFGDYSQEEMLGAFTFDRFQAYALVTHDERKLALIINEMDEKGEFQTDFIIPFTEDLAEKLATLREEAVAKLEAIQLEAEQPDPQADERVPEGFFKNTGEMPVPEGTLVEVEFGDGRRTITEAGTISPKLMIGERLALEWSLEKFPNRHADIIYWRRVTEDELIKLFFKEPVPVPVDDDIPF